MKLIDINKINDIDKINDINKINLYFNDEID